MNGTKCKSSKLRIRRCVLNLFGAIAVVTGTGTNAAALEFGCVAGKPMRYETGGGGDTIGIDGTGCGVKLQVYDSASPATLKRHDRLVLYDIKADATLLSRTGDDLVLFVKTNAAEIKIEQHYCRALGVAAEDTPNHEVEEFRFPASREIWLADALFDLYGTSPQTLGPTGAENWNEQQPDGLWRVRPFRDVMPDYAQPATACSTGDDP